MIIDTFVVAIADSAHCLLIGLANKVSGILVLTRALGCHHIIFRELITALAAEHSVMIRGCERICNIRLTAETVAAVLRLAVYGVARNADGFLQNGDATLIF